MVGTGRFPDQSLGFGKATVGSRNGSTHADTEEYGFATVVGRRLFFGFGNPLAAKLYKIVTDSDIGSHADSQSIVLFHGLGQQQRDIQADMDACKEKGLRSEHVSDPPFI